MAWSNSRPILLVFLALATNVPCWSQNPRAHGVTPITTQQRLFSIPFFLNPNSQQPAEIHLFVSGDQGDNWFHYQGRRPDQRKFDFQAGEDGTYWFVVRTEHQANKPNKPNKSTKPEKIVVVDQIQPDLELSLQIGPTGELIASWQAEDVTLDQQSFRLAYRSSATQTWQPVVVPNKLTVSTGSKTNGRQSWSVSRDATNIEVKAEISDQAGNTRQISRHVSLLSSAQNLSATADKPAPRDNGRQLVDAPPAWTTTSVASNSKLENGWQSKGFAETRLTKPGQTLPPATVEAVATANRNNNPESTQPTPPPTRQAYEPPVAGQPEPTPPANRTITRHSRFNLDYEMTGINGFGADRVELWITENAGETWRPFGVDSDRISPFEVQTEREGVYGFRLLIHDSAGNSARPPQPGEAPDLTVVVDMTRPKVQLISATYSPERPNSVSIRWQATDDYLKTRPVKISFAPLPTGPWSMIDSDVPNNGDFEWAPEHRLPGKVYIRVEATDEAGNVGMDQSPQAVGMSPNGPRGIIRQVRPIE